MKPRRKPFGTVNRCGANIERLAKLRGMKQYEMTIRLNLQGIQITPSGVSKIYGQIRGCSDKELYAFSRILGVSMETLMAEFGGESV